ncbi:hypothetical protein Snoj_29360 [Streptomyces nojiriensis]|uniref:Uncharacterized protein n=1 Tax=Streptomyces nojiriensis TaxID=66374 RepID=A0ABQ3SLK0_9ACTN|nr:hypothetical protein GCM10010205_77480 [Streptomyces nojiriensis]GHI69018.1 hypothetical protein Snoj_29360 [Streptomyces nojiriensis]
MKSPISRMPGARALRLVAAAPHGHLCPEEDPAGTFHPVSGIPRRVAPVRALPLRPAQPGEADMGPADLG